MEMRDDFRQQIRAERRLGAKSDRPGDTVPVGLGEFDDLSDFLPYRPRTLGHLTANSRHDDTASTAINEPDAECTLERLQLRTQGGLGKSAIPCRLAEMQCARDFEEALELA
ncbi:hypothetical protein OH818_17990 [Jiella pelagia]|uniref:Uncharacterized protein n=1 Tax=Jiella pelagia TaxID=2986949 RepID=A0ABY7C8J8_9HYPH|nr:hypothetical protein [Jiella pelagia]WAP71374.1 hypothetical protein OH818_17990 [Jiella pelagia]